MSRIVSVKQRHMPMNDRRKIRDADPELHYRYARNDPDRIRFLHEAYGYNVVHQDSKTKSGDPTSLDGAVMGGGDVLMACPREEYEARLKERERINKENMRGPRETFKMEAHKRGVKTVDLSTEFYGTMEDAERNN